MRKAYLVTEVTVTDPSTEGEVQVSIFKDETSGGMFGIDSSYIEQNFDEDEDVIIKSPFNEGQEVLLEGI